MLRNSIRKRVLLSLLPLFFLAACSNQFAYNTLPFWIDYYVSDYVDMNRQQQAQFDRDLEAFHSWHRTNELPQIQQLLTQLRSDMAQPLTYGQIGEYHQRVNERMLASLSGLTPAMTNLIASLSDEQVQEWMAVVNDKIAEGVEKATKGSAKEQITRRQDRLLERAEEWLNAVNDKQKSQLFEMASYQIEMRPVFYSIRDNLVAELGDILENRQSPDLAERINHYFARLIILQHDAYKTDMALYLARRYELLQRLDRHLSDKQRQAFRGKLFEYNQDIAAVMN